MDSSMSKSAEGKSAEEVTAESIIARYVEVTGGESAYRSMKSMVVTGTFSIPAQNIRGPLKVQATAAGPLLIEADIPGLGKQTQGGDGTTYWERSPMAGVRLITGEERDKMIRDFSPLADIEWKSFYPEAVVKGVKDIEGKPAHVIEMTDTHGRKETRYYDVESGLLVRKDSVSKTQMGELPSVTLYSDYQETGGGRVESRKQILQIGGIEQVITMDSITYNVKIDPSVFAIPEDVQPLIKK